MDYEKLIYARHSIRKFKDKPIPESKLIKILDAARRAPSAGNLQAYEVVIVRDPTKKDALCRAAFNQPAVCEAPVVLVFLADPLKSASKYGARGAELYSIQDATIACAYAQLMVTNVGLSSVWIGAFDESRVKKIINAGPLKPISLLPIGYPNEKPLITSRRNINEFVHYENI